MPRVVSLHLPTWPTDRVRRNAAAPPPAEPLVTARREGSRRVLVGVDAAAAALGLRPGLTVAHAQALVPDLHVAEASPEAEGAELTRLAAWCLRYAPVVAADPPDGIWIDVTGAAHLVGGEDALLDDLVDRFGRAGIAARAAIADTPGAAWALARFGRVRRADPWDLPGVLEPLPVAALRLPPDIVDALRRLGIERIGEVLALPGAPLSRRLGLDLCRRLDQALGHVPEPIAPLVPPETIRRRIAFPEPIGAPETLARVTARLCADLCRDLEARELGVRRLDLVFGRVDGGTRAVRVATARPSRDLAHLARLLTDRLEEVDPGFGIEEAVLAATRVEPLPPGQLGVRGIDEADAPLDLGPLVDVLAARLGPARVYRQAPVESDIPERSVTRVAPLAPPTGTGWPGGLGRPVRLIDPPEPVRVTALLPDNPPAAFTWRSLRRKVVCSDGPERVLGEWWRSADEASSFRDYYRVEDERGQRYWIFRDAPSDQGGRWFLHGLFG
ncbi:Y-family DNA polymerase [Salinarimonas soli]|uniref:DNA-directed DNA polymerase n=1 Tax=Salinarimonas soli TaxID=1638099 RepID=A0A5B2V3D3_9HYPH|nr:DNA polymerase Y family protein [Salinarimonas soli]KAA2233140.1 DNA polymerase Y family protein [Salinarimonas soli]